MGLTARKPEQNEDFEPIEAGVQQAICIRYYDLGTHYMEKFNKSARKVMLMWEIPGSRIEIEGKDLPRAISKEYGLTLHKKAYLRIDLESWRGKVFTKKELEGFDLDNILGANCMLNIVHNITDQAIYANVVSVMPLMKDMPKKEPENPLISFNFDDPEIEIPKNTPQWIEDKIKASEEWELFVNSTTPKISSQDSEKGSPADELSEDKPWSTLKEFIAEIKSFAERLGTDEYDRIINVYKADRLDKLSKEQGLELWKSLRSAEKAQDDTPGDKDEKDNIPF